MPAAARKGDLGVPHCTPYSISGGSSDVIINGRGAARMLDSVTPHLLPVGKKCVKHAPVIITGSSSVFINGQPAAYMGSKVALCTFIAMGSTDVFVGI